MKVIMVIIICFGANCQAIWEKNYYPSIEECVTASAPVKTYMMDVYPNSAGEIHCMTEGTFEDYIQFLEEGGKPSLTTIPDPDAS
jgi:hypothetical protein|tara:strand:- start:255 stop:509 length:255 start_codon:yes stop_codon:yes gene_type:complete